MKANQATYPVRVMSRLLGVSPSGFYAWVQRPLSARAVEDIGLTALIHATHRRSDGAYGAPSIHAELADDHARRVGKKRVARLMRAACGWPTLPTCRRGRGFSTWPSCSVCGRVAWSAGPWRRTCAPSWS